MFDDGRLETVAENVSGNFRDAFGVERVKVGNAAAENDHVRIQHVNQIGQGAAEVAEEYFMNSTAFGSPA